MRNQPLRGHHFWLAPILAAAVVLAISGCGSSSSGDATSLLRQTFGGSHKVNSGNLSFSLSITPSGSKTLTSPISLNFGGPFQSRGTGKLPESNFTISLSAQGKTGSLGIVSTGDTGYVVLSGTAYQLPQASFQKLESSFSQIASSSTGSGSGKSALSRLGINPLRWLNNPSVVGTETVGGTSTTHVRASVNVSALLGDLSTFLSKASSLGVAGAGRIPTSISPATRAKIAAEVQNPSFDVWTGASDKTVRKLRVGLTLPVTGQLSTLLGGLRSAAIVLTISYAALNQPQTIAAPTQVAPFSQFSTKLRSFLAGTLGSVASGVGSAGSSSSSSSSSSGGAPPAYAQCIQAAGNDVSKMQQCASLLTSGG